MAAKPFVILKQPKVLSARDLASKYGMTDSEIESVERAILAVPARKSARARGPFMQSRRGVTLSFKRTAKKR